MGFFEDINDAVMEGLRQGPSPSWFGGLKVKRKRSPIDPAVLTGQYQCVLGALAAWQNQLHEQCGGDDAQSLAASLSEVEAWTYFNELNVPSPHECYLFEPWRGFVEAMASMEPIFQPLEPNIAVADLPAEERLKLHERLVYLENVLQEPDHYLNAWSDHLFLFARHTLEQLPEEIRTAPLDANLTLSCPLIDCLPDPHAQLASLLRHFLGCDVLPVLEQGLFVACQEKLLAATLAFSNLKLEDLEKKELDTPVNHQTTPAAELVPKFLGTTPFRKLLLTPVPYGL